MLAAHWQHAAGGTLSLHWGFTLYHIDDLAALFDPRRAHSYRTYSAFRRPVQEQSSVRAEISPPRKWQPTRLNCTTLELELRAARRLDGRWDHVDLLSLDVEGHEDAVLRGVDWTRVRIDHILCERACEAVLRPMGYVAAKLPPSPGKRISEVTEVLWTRPGLPRVAFPRRQG